MNHSLYAVVTFFIFLVAYGTIAQERRFGLGVILGEPTGISAKLWVSPATAFDFGLGWSIGGDRVGNYDGGYDGGSRAHFHMDYLWHWFNAIQSSERFPLYTGVGGRINSGAGYKSTAAVRGVVGIAWLPHQTPIDIFLEIVPSLQVVPSTGFGIDAGLGARFFF
jgi:hypothetical protein